MYSCIVAMDITIWNQTYTAGWFENQFSNTQLMEDRYTFYELNNKIKYQASGENRGTHFGPTSPTWAQNWFYET